MNVTRFDPKTLNAGDQYFTVSEQVFSRSGEDDYDTEYEFIADAVTFEEACEIVRNLGPEVKGRIYISKMIRSTNGGACGNPVVELFVYTICVHQLRRCQPEDHR